MKRRSKLYVLLVILVFFITTFIYSRHKDIMLEKNGIYGIATITKITGAKSGLRVFFKFPYLKDTIYTDYVDGSGTIQFSDLNKRFFIKFSPSSPSGSCELIYGRRPPDTMKAPANGWAKLPNY